MAILSYTMPFWVVIFAALFLGERLRRGQYFAILIAAFGLFFGVAAVATRFLFDEKCHAGNPLRCELGRARLLLNVCMPAIRAWIYCR